MVINKFIPKNLGGQIYEAEQEAEEELSSEWKRQEPLMANRPIEQHRIKQSIAEVTDTDSPEQSEPMKRVKLDKGEIKKAIIYSEILKPKF